MEAVLDDNQPSLDGVREKRERAREKHDVMGGGSRLGRSGFSIDSLRATEQLPHFASIVNRTLSSVKLVWLSTTKRIRRFGVYSFPFFLKEDQCYQMSLSMATLTPLMVIILPTFGKTNRHNSVAPFYSRWHLF